MSVRLDEDGGIMDLDGIVVRSRRHEGQNLWGIKFHGNDPGTRTRLRDWVFRRRR